MKIYFRCFLLFTILCSTPAFSNINVINLKNISYLNLIQEDLDFVLKHEDAFNHWSETWTYDISIEESLERLKKIQEVSAKKAQNIDEWLLTGTISHYRYNLNDDEQFPIAESAFQKAIALDTSNYISYWFLGNHYAHSAKPKESMLNFFKAEKLNPNIRETAFWHDYTFASYLSGMFSHTQKSLDIATKLGTPSPIDEVLRNALKEKITTPDAAKEYKPQELWDYQPNGAKNTFISKALGVRFTVDSTWNWNISKYNKRTAVVVLSPKAELNDKDVPIDYTIMLMIHVADGIEDIKQYANRFVGKYPDKIATNRFDSLQPSEAYEIINKEMYTHIGGGHFNFVALERPKPTYPGLQLEAAQNFPFKDRDSTNETLEVYQVKSSFHRFDENIQYVLILDTCEDIYPQSLKALDAFLKSLVIE